MTNLAFKRNKRKFRVHNNIRLRNKSDRLRLSVFKSNNHIYAQLIDDIKGITLVSASTLTKEIKESLVKKGINKELAKQVGVYLSKIAEEKKLPNKVSFDKGSFKYHGVIKSLADGARESKYLVF